MISIRKNKNAIDFTHQTDLALQSRSCRMYSVMQRDMEYGISERNQSNSKTNGSDTSVFRDLNNKQIILLLSRDVRQNLKMIHKAFKKRQMNLYVTQLCFNVIESPDSFCPHQMRFVSRWRIKHIATHLRNEARSGIDGSPTQFYFEEISARTVSTMLRQVVLQKYVYIINIQKNIIRKRNKKPYNV